MKRFRIVSQLPPKNLFRAWDQARADPAFADAIALLTADHRMIENLLAAFAHTGDSQRRRRLARQIRASLEVHALIEEEILLPALRGRIAQSAIEAARGRHARVRALIAAIEEEGGAPAALAEEIGAQIGAEEAPGTGLFSKARAAGIDLVALRDLILARKAAATSRAGQAEPANSISLV